LYWVTGLGLGALGGLAAGEVVQVARAPPPSRPAGLAPAGHIGHIRLITSSGPAQPGPSSSRSWCYRAIVVPTLGLGLAQQRGTKRASYIFKALAPNTTATMIIEHI
jgi:hypothetical protein